MSGSRIGPFGFVHQRLRRSSNPLDFCFCSRFPFNGHQGIDGPRVAPQPLNRVPLRLRLRLQFFIFRIASIVEHRQRHLHLRRRELSVLQARPSPSLCLRAGFPENLVWNRVLSPRLAHARPVSWPARLAPAAARHQRGRMPSNQRRNRDGRGLDVFQGS